MITLTPLVCYEFQRIFLNREGFVLKMVLYLMSFPLVNLKYVTSALELEAKNVKYAPPVGKDNNVISLTANSSL